MNLADQLIDHIVNNPEIPLGERRREIQRELRSHIEEFVAVARKAGNNQREIEQSLLAHFGDPAEVARGFGWVYRYERRRMRIFTYALSTILLATSSCAAILIVQTGLALGFGRPIINVIASRHTVIEALDILASVAAYLALISLDKLFVRRPFQKAACLLVAIVTILVIACGEAGLHVSFLVFGLVNALFLRAVQRFFTHRTTRVGIVAVSFLLAGFVSASIWSPASYLYPLASWLAMGAGYLLMTDTAARFDAALLQRIQASY